MKKKKVRLLLSSKIVLGLILSSFAISVLLYYVPFIMQKNSFEDAFLLMRIQDKSVYVFLAAHFTSFLAAGIAVVQDTSIEIKLRKLANGEIKDLDKNELEEKASKKWKAAKIYLAIWVILSFIMFLPLKANVKIEKNYPYFPYTNPGDA